MTRCTDRQAKQALEALFRGELDGEGYQRLRAHAAGCAECREAYDKLSRVESVLDKRALPSGREALLRQELFARLGVATKPARAPVPERKRFFSLYFMPMVGGLAVAAMAVLLVVPQLRERDSEFQARGAETGTSAWGVRAFCVGANGEVQGEARPGGTLVCAEGGTVQFSYTAPEGARLTISTTSPSGEPLRFFPPEGVTDEVAAGVDVPLPYSTPVEGGWLAGPLDVEARFTDARGQPVGETRLRLSPR